MPSEITAIATYFPTDTLSTAALSDMFPEWPAEQIAQKTGIVERRIAAVNEYSLDLAYEAARELFRSGFVAPSDVDLLIFCTQTPERLIPAGACFLQDRLGLGVSTGAFDFNLGCSGYVYGLGIAEGFICSGQASVVLFITADTVSKILDPGDKGMRTLIGDGAAATLVRATAPGDQGRIGPFVYGTDGSGAPRLTAGCGGVRRHENPDSVNPLFMDGPDLFSFAIRRVPEAVQALLSKAGVELDAVDLFVFHQANLHMLEHLRGKLRIPRDRFELALETVGNTAASSIPIALKQAACNGKLRPGSLVMLLGFGAGFSWSATLVRWSPQFGVSVR